ncbi:uncharacterized protein EV154DRAFT_604744 [Mucor mucedo]|uniref:uncharacterized protein n=1 Tax=Mucor mucedo TaxID=29922 RepID=UPI00221F2537|nr:uncharacterized protein EV154DRAFT_604744 [Mucor mucedo]KAI7888557.1 hypothetical protein EV154DRAFT_604744 [Mucor mucedo]
MDNKLTLLYSLCMHIDKPHLFSKASRKEYSEFDYQIKFWGVIFEAFFYNDDYMLHWGDTVSKPCKRNNLRFKADLRIVVMSKDEDVVDGTTAEVAKKAQPFYFNTSPKKLFMDKLKSVLGTKCHVNNFLSSVPFIPAKDIKNVVFPIVQIMGFDVHIYSLQLVNRSLYVLQDLDSFSFPTNYTSLKHGLAKVINGLSCIESLLVFGFSGLVPILRQSEQSSSQVFVLEHTPPFLDSSNLRLEHHRSLLESFDFYSEH